MHSAKIITSIIALFAVVLIASFYTTNILSSTSNKLENHISSIESNVKSDNWSKAEQDLSNTQKTWNKTQKSWAILLDHVEIDNIDSTLARLSNYVDTKNKPLILGEIAVLRQYVKHIPDKETPELRNIL